MRGGSTRAQRGSFLRFRFFCALALLSGTVGLVGGSALAAPQGGPQTIYWSGPQGGPFPSGATSVSLDNPLAYPVRWRSFQSVPFVISTPPSGWIPANGSVGASAQIDASVANGLAVGTYTADLSLNDRQTQQWTVLVRLVLTVEAASGGWTQLAPSSDSRMVHVSSSTGNDQNNGLSPSAPKRTLAAAKALLRNGYPDWLLLMRGDTWNESLGQWICSGRSPSEPSVITSYGVSSARPFLRTGSSDGITAIASGSSPPSIHDVAIVGLHLKADTYDGSGAPSGINWMIQSNGLLVEDCLIERYQIDVSVPGYGGQKHDIKIRRNVIVDAFATSGTVGHGIYMANSHDVLIEENILDKNGWNASVPGAVPSIFRHGIYIQSGSGACSNVTVRGNIISNSSSHGLHLRPGGVAEDNLFLRNSIALSLGGGNEPNPGGVTTLAKGNVILDGKDIDPANHRGWGIDLANIASGAVTFNIVANQGAANYPIPMNLYGHLNGIGVHDTQVTNNVVSNWGGSLNVQGNAAQLTAIDISSNDFRCTIDQDPLLSFADPATIGILDASRNRFLSAAPSGSWFLVGSTHYSLPLWETLVGDPSSSVLPQGAYPDPSRTIATYSQSLGGAPTHDAFMNQARLQSKANWRLQYTAAAGISYIRAGFGLVVP